MGRTHLFRKLIIRDQKLVRQKEDWKPWNETLKRTGQHQKRTVTLSESMRLPITDTLISINIHGTAPKNLFSCVPI